MEGWELSEKRKKQKAEVGTDGGGPGHEQGVGGRLGRGRRENGLEVTRRVWEGDSRGGSLSTGCGRVKWAEAGEVKMLGFTSRILG